jgi:hypothetical protein
LVQANGESGLTAQGQLDRIAFLHSLTDESFVSNPGWADPVHRARDAPGAAAGGAQGSRPARLRWDGTIAHGRSGLDPVGNAGAASLAGRGGPI